MTKYLKIDLTLIGSTNLFNFIKFIIFKRILIKKTGTLFLMNAEKQSDFCAKSLICLQMKTKQKKSFLTFQKSLVLKKKDRKILEKNFSGVFICCVLEQSEDRNLLHCSVLHKKKNC